MRPNIALHPYQRLYLGVEPIAHELELAIGWDEADRSIVLEPWQPHALMEFHVLHLDRLASCRPTRRLKHDFVVEAQT